METPSISVVIPTYNRASVLPRAVASVLSQTYRVRQICIVDDGSTDETRQVASTLSGPIAYLRQDNQGPAAARNLGIRNTEASLVAFLDSDDEWLPNKLALQVDYLRRHPDTSLLCTDFSDYENDLLTKSSLTLTLSPASGRIFTHLLTSQFISMSTVIVRREVLDIVGHFDESLRAFEDRDLWYRIARHHEIAFIPASLVRRHLDGTNITSNPSVMLNNKVKLYSKARMEALELNHEEKRIVNHIRAETYSQLGYHHRTQRRQRLAVVAYLQSIYYRPTVTGLFAITKSLLRLPVAK